WADTFTAMGMNTTARCEKTQIFSLALPTPNSIGCGFGNIGVLTRSSFGAEVIPTWVGTAIFKIVRKLGLNSQVVQAARLINLSVSAWRAAKRAVRMRRPLGV